MKPGSRNSFQGITLASCQVCRQFKNKFYVCDRNHTTCDDCKQTKEEAPQRPALVSHTRASPVGNRKRFVLPLTPESPQSASQLFPKQTSKTRLSPSSAASIFGDDPWTSREATSPSRISSHRLRSPSNDPPSIFSSRSPIKSLVTIPKPNRVIIEESALGSEDFSSGGTLSPVESRTPQSRNNRSPPGIVEDDYSQGELKEGIFCRSCGDFVEVIPITFPKRIIESPATKCLDSIEPAEIEDVEEYSGESADLEDLETTTSKPMTSLEGLDEQSLRRDVDKLRDGLLTTYSELMTAKSDLDEVIYATEKLEMDVDIMRGGVNYVYFNFDSILKRPEVRQEARICGIPFVLMVRLRNVARVPHVGFFVGLEPNEGRAHSPLKKIIVLRAHNAYGKVIEENSMRTFADGRVAHLCFDLRKPQDGGMYGYSNFLKKARILRPDMLKDGRLCLSLQIKPLL